MANLKHGDSGASETRKGFFARLFDSIAESRMRQIEHEMGPHYAEELERIKREQAEAEQRSAH